MSSDKQAVNCLTLFRFTQSFDQGQTVCLVGLAPGGQLDGSLSGPWQVQSECKFDGARIFRFAADCLSDRSFECRGDTIQRFARERLEHSAQRRVNGLFVQRMHE